MVVDSVRCGRRRFVIVEMIPTTSVYKPQMGRDLKNYANEIMLTFLWLEFVISVMDGPQFVAIAKE